MKKLTLNKKTVVKLDENQLKNINGGAQDGFLSWFGCGCGKRATDPLTQKSCVPTWDTNVQNPDTTISCQVG